MKKKKIFKHSNSSVRFISKYALKEFDIKSKIDEQMVEKILIFAKNCELNMIDEDGTDKDYEYPNKEKDILGDLYISEVSGKHSKNIEIDLDDLNT